MKYIEEGRELLEGLLAAKENTVGTYMYANMEEEYERVKKLSHIKKSDPSWVLNPGPSDC